MAEQNVQMTGDPERIVHLLAVRDGLKDGPRAEIEMHSGLKYSGSVSNLSWSSQKNQEVGTRLGVFIILDTGKGMFRLDALDIKTWKATSTPSPVPVVEMQPR